MDARSITRLGMLAIGLGIGAAVASTPVVAWADSDFQISIDGHDLFPATDNLATATSGTGDIAIAFGDGASASANGGIGDFALADGSDAYAMSGGSGTPDSTAQVVSSGANFNTAVDIGNNTGTGDGAIAGIGGSDDTTSSGDTAIDVGNNSANYDGALAIAGNDNHSSAFGANDYALTGIGNHNFADIVGPNSEAVAGGDIIGGINGNNEVAYVFDPFGTAGDTARSGPNFDGTAGNSDLAAVLGVDDKVAGADGGNLVYDIVTALGHETGTAASTGGGLLAELLSLF